MLTREELEDIMNNQPFGAGKHLMKKGMKKTTFIAMPFKKNSLEPIEISVISSDKDAFQDVQRKFYSSHAKNIDYDGVDWKRKI